MSDKPSWAALTREEWGLRHWERASYIAQWLDEAAGSNEAAAGAILGMLIRNAPPGCARIMV